MKKRFSVFCLLVIILMFFSFGCGNTSIQSPFAMFYEELKTIMKNERDYTTAMFKEATEDVKSMPKEAANSFQVFIDFFKNAFKI